MPFAKLDEGIIRSSIWFEPAATVKLWITFLALKDENGFVATSRQGLKQTANITQEEFDRGLNTLESPDPDSRTPDNEGRRVSKMYGGWLVLNHEKYRDSDQMQRDKTKERVKRFREKQRVTSDVTLRNVTEALPSVSVSVSVSESVKKEECEKETKPQIHFDDWYKLYPRKESRGKAEQAWRKIPNKKETSELIIKALEWQNKQEQWKKENGQFIPLPGSYINGKKWLDEPNKETGYTQRKYGNQRATDEEIKDQLERMKGKLDEPNGLFSGMGFFNQDVQTRRRLDDANLLESTPLYIAKSV